MKKNEGFSSLWGFILVAIGMALGIGSLWRFPYVVGENGGALFILMYIIIILVVGIPLMTCEITLGFHTQHAAVDAYKTLSPKSRFYLTGYLHLFAAILILGYTAPIYAWIVKYVAASLQGSFMGLSPDGIAAFFQTFRQDKGQVLLFYGINLFMNAAVLLFGIQKGIERISKLLLPALFVIMIMIIISVIRLPGASEGLRFMFLPDFSRFTLQSMLTCLGQAFFALGLGMLGSLVFGSYIRNPKEKIFNSAALICTALIVAGIFAGLMVLPMVFATGLEVTEGVALSFLTLPNAFNHLPGGSFLAILFYFGFYIAAFTSSVSVHEAVVGQLTERWQMGRTKAIILSALVIFAIAAPSIYSEKIFIFLDVLESNYVLVLSCLLIALFCGYVWKMDNVMRAANIENPWIKRWMRISIKYIAPPAILLIFLAQFF